MNPRGKIIARPFSTIPWIGRRTARGCGWATVAVVLVGAAAATTLTAPAAFGQVCSSGFYAWSPPTPGTTSGPASAPAMDTAFNPLGHSYSYFAQGTTLFAFRNVAEPGCTMGDCAAGGIKWTWAASSTIQNFPSPVPLTPPSDPTQKEWIFVTTSDGLLYKINAENGMSVTKVDTRRCTTTPCILDVNGIATNPVCAADQLIATPAVQLNSFSNSTFQTNVAGAPGAHAADDDLVFVITRNSCGDTTHNRVIAYWASNLTVKWVFNDNNTNTGSSPHKMDFGSDGCTIDYDNNKLYCGTFLADTASSQNSLWAISSLDGTLQWSTNAGSILNRPMLSGLSGGRLFVANSQGAVMAYDPAGDGMGKGAPLWSTAVQMPAAVVRNPWPEFRSGPLQGKILVLDIAGNLRAIRDDGSTGTVLWNSTATGSPMTMPCPAGALCYRSMPVVSPSTGKIYLGRNDGRVQQLSPSLAREGVMDVNFSATNGADVYDPSLDLEGVSPDVNRLVAAASAGSGGKITRLIVPLCETPPIGVISCNCGAADVCGTGAVGDPFRCCNLAQDSCNGAASNNPCTPWRCSPQPDCCFDFSCGPEINCDAATNTCLRYTGGPSFKVPDGTICDDGKACTFTFPDPVPVTCAFRPSDGSNCTNDSDCTAPGMTSCSGTGTATPGSGGGIVGGKCCPVGTACNFGTNKCLGNNGSATLANSNDVCLSGVCSSDQYTSCACVNPGDRACASGLTCCGSSKGGCVDLQNDPQHCGSCDTDCGTGSCHNGVCSESSGCSAPTLAELQANAPLGADAIAFDRTSGNVCAGYVATYRSGIPNFSTVRRIAAGGVLFDYLNANPGPLNGVAVSLPGDQLFSSYVNADGFSFVPGLAQGSVTPTSGSFARVLNATSTAGTLNNPFADSNFNRGPVGPAFDYVSYLPGMPTTRVAYFGNWSANGDLLRVSFNGSAWQAAPLVSPSYSNPAGERITAIAFEKRKFTPSGTYHRYLVIAHGTTLSFLDLDAGPTDPPQIDVNLATAYLPVPSRGESQVEAILSIAVHPFDGDVLVEVRGNGVGTGGVKNRFLLNVDAHDHSCRHEVVVQQDQHKAGSPVPDNFGAGDGRIVISPSLQLIRFVPVVNTAPISWTTYTVTPP